MKEGGLRQNGFVRFTDKSEPIISIITVVLNNPNGLLKTIRSIIQQNYINLEVIIIDGGSNNKTLNVIRKFNHKIDYWITEKDNGIYDAMNKGIDNSTGNIIGILNAGDCYYNETINIVSETFKKNKFSELVFGDVVMCRTNYNKMYIASVKNRKFNDGWMPHPAVFIKKKVYRDFGCFDTQLRISSDYELMLRIKSKINMVHVDRPLVKMEMVGASTNNLFLKTNEDYHVRKKYGYSILYNISLTVLSIVSSIISEIIRCLFDLPEFRFENSWLFSWFSNDENIFFGNHHFLSGRK